MKIINNNIIDFSFEENGELNTYDITIYVNMIPYKSIYNTVIGFIHCSLEDESILVDVSNEIKKILESRD